MVNKKSPVITVNSAVAKKALELAAERDVHIEVVDANTVIVKNGKR